MSLSLAHRQQRRREHVASFLRELRIAPDRLADSTTKCLDDWARQELLVKAQPSANHWNAILGLCRAVESQVASTLGGVHDLGFLADSIPLGPKAHGLLDLVGRENGSLPAPTSEQLLQRGIDPIFVSKRLSPLLLRLARIRAATHAAHGDAEIEEATEADAVNARKTAGRVLSGLCCPPPGENR